LEAEASEAEALLLLLMDRDISDEKIDNLFELLDLTVPALGYDTQVTKI
jgi:hypothetical protein